MAEANPESTNMTEKYYFLVRRLHSLSGLIPVGVFLFLHLSTNASILAPGKPGAQFQEQVERIHSLGPLLVPVEIVGIFIPLAFHVIVGFQIMLTARSNAQNYAYGGNIRYTLQRATGMIAFVFILYHVWQMHWMGEPFGGGAFKLEEDGAPAAARTTAAAIQAGGWIAAVYAIGILASVFHLANGIWTSLITWGITIRPRSQKVAGYVCSVIGVLLAVAGLGALYGFQTFKLDQQTTISAEATESVASHDH